MSTVIGEEAAPTATGRDFGGTLTQYVIGYLKEHAPEGTLEPDRAGRLVHTRDAAGCADLGLATSALVPVHTQCTAGVRRRWPLLTRDRA
jgi:hypothetical protein